MLAVPGLPDETERTVYVDPYTAQVRGSLDTWYDTPPLQTTLDALHRNLLLGEPGRVYSELAASWLWVLVLGGLALWIGRRRRRAPLAEAVLPPRGARPGRRRMMGWHGAAGVWLSVALLFISATGLTWSSHAGARFPRRPTRAGRVRLTPPVRRGNLRALPPPMVFGIVLATVVVGWLLPVLGVSLLLFLAGDAAAGALARRRTRRPA